MNIIAALTEAHVDVGVQPPAYKHICSHVQEMGTQRGKLVRSHSTYQCLPFDGSSRNRQHGMQTRRTNVGEWEREASGKMGTPDLPEKKEERSESRGRKKENVAQNSKWIVIGKLKF